MHRMVGSRLIRVCFKKPTLYQMRLVTPTSSIGFDRQMSTTTSNNTTVVLYQSDPTNDQKFRRDLLLTYTVSMGGPALLYGLSAYEVINMSPYWGIGASVVGGGVMLGTAKFVRDAFSKIAWQESPTPGILVYGYTLPFRYPSQASTFYKYGDCKLFLAAKDAQELVETLMTEEESSSHTEGFVPLEIPERRWPMGIFLRSRSEIKQRDLFLDALVDFGKDHKVSKKTTKKTKRKPKPPKKLNKGMGRTV